VLKQERRDDSTFLHQLNIGKWVTIGVDPIRGIREDYLEVPKRQKYNKKANKGK